MSSVLPPFALDEPSLLSGVVSPGFFWDGEGVVVILGGLLIVVVVVGAGVCVRSWGCGRYDEGYLAGWRARKVHEDTVRSRVVGRGEGEV